MSLHDSGMNASINDLKRMLQSIVRIGDVTDVDLTATPPRVRVRSGDLHTDWIAWLTPCAANTAHWRPLVVGESVVILSIGGDPGNAVVIGSVFTQTNRPPSDSANKSITLYPDGARIEYDHEQKKLTASVPGDVSITAGGSVTVKASGAVSIESGAVVSIKAAEIRLDGPVVTTSTITAEADVTAGGVSVMQHKHGGIQSGPGKTGKPE